jgi:hypothetical protein
MPDDKKPPDILFWLSEAANDPVYDTEEVDPPLR